MFSARTSRSTKKSRGTTHAIAGNPGTYVRIVLIACSILVVASVARRTDTALTDFFGFHANNLAVLYAILVGFIASEVIGRRHTLDEYVALELNKIRRIYHLALHVSHADPALKPWFVRVKLATKNYLRLFSRIDFMRYAEGSPLFRELTYAVYERPAPKDTANDELYFALVEATGEATEAREFLRSTLKNKYVGYFAWMILLTVSVSYATFLILSTPPIFEAQVATGFVVFNLFIVLQLIFEYGRINKRKSDYYCQLYLEDLESLGLETGKKK